MVIIMEKVNSNGITLNTSTKVSSNREKCMAGAYSRTLLAFSKVTLNSAT